MILAQNGKFSSTSGSNNYTLSARNYDRNIFCFSVWYLLLVELNNELQLKKASKWKRMDLLSILNRSGEPET